ncbi:MAG TPA: DUF6714 family protein [Gemmatimonadota bacterium]|nr:DUF6714 family protein [Gemmatimonadota bacterium]
MDDRTVLELVEGAFARVDMPSEEVLVNHHCCECLETSEAYAGAAWQEVTLDQLLAGRETALLTVEAWRYYLPAVIAWSVRDPAAVDVIADNLVFQLTPPGDGGALGGWFEPRASGFDPAQRAAIAAFLEWFAERERASWGELGAVPPGRTDRALAHWSTDIG